MDEIGRALGADAREASEVAGSPGSTEATFYPAAQRLLGTVLQARGLPFDVRVNTSQRRTAGSSLIQAAFYGPFASWTRWHHSNERRDFHWRDLGGYLKIPFLGALSEVQKATHDAEPSAVA